MGYTSSYSSIGYANSYSIATYTSSCSSIGYTATPYHIPGTAPDICKNKNARTSRYVYKKKRTTPCEGGREGGRGGGGGGARTCTVAYRTLIWRVHWTYAGQKLLASILAGSISRLLLPVHTEPVSSARYLAFKATVRNTKQGINSSYVTTMLR